MANYINFDNVASNEYISTEGTHVLTIKSVEFGTSPSGSAYHKFTCANPAGETINHTLFITEKSLWKYKQFMQVLGFTVKGIIDIETMSHSAVGKTFVGDLERKMKAVMNDYGVMVEQESKYLEIVKVRTYTKLAEKSLKADDEKVELPF
jgi:hypothetical protein